MTLYKHRLGADINEYDWCELSWFVDVFPWSHSMYITTYQYRLVEQAWWLCACPVWPKFKLRLKLILYIRMNSDIFGRTTQGPPKVKPQNLTYLLGLFDVRPGVLNVFFAHLKKQVFFPFFLLVTFWIVYNRASHHEANFSKSLAWVFFWCLFMFRNDLKKLKNLGRSFHD